MSQLSITFYFKIQCNQYHLSPKKSRTVPHEVTMNDIRKNAQSSLKIANDATKLALSTFPKFLTYNIQPFIPPCDYSTIWQQSKFVKNVWDMNLLWKLLSVTEIPTEHANVVTTIKSPNTILNLFAIIQTIYVPFLLSQWMKMWNLFNLSTGFTGQTFPCACLKNLSIWTWIRSGSYTSDLKRRPFFSQRRTC